MPNLATHKKVYEMLGYNAVVCEEIDKLIDVEPPLFREIFSESTGEKRLWKNFGFRKVEFPLMYRYVLKNFGLEGIKCLVTHYVLDYIESLLYKGFDINMIKDEVKALISSYIEECNVHKEDDFAEVNNILLQVFKDLLNRFDDIAQAVKSSSSLDTSPIELIVNASTDLISIELHSALIAKGYKGKSGFTVSSSIFNEYMRIYNKVRRLLKQTLNEALRNRIIVDPQGLLESINNIKKQTAETRTIGDVIQAVKEEGIKNYDFYKLLEMIKHCVEEAIKSSSFSSL